MLLQLTSAANYKPVLVKADIISHVVPSAKGSEVFFALGPGAIKIEVTQDAGTIHHMVNGHKECQATVASWRLATFGRAPDPAKLVARAGEEFLELMGLLLPDADQTALADLRDEWAKAAKSPGPEALEKIKDEMADVLIVLYGAAEGYGFNLARQVDRKMEVNRERKWNARGDGTGQHA